MFLKHFHVFQFAINKTGKELLKKYNADRYQGEHFIIMLSLLQIL